jgi:membrane-associated phospholipid phosphatase
MLKETSIHHPLLSPLWRNVVFSFMGILVICVLSWVYFDIPIAEFFHKVRIFRKPSKYITALGNGGMWVALAFIGMAYGLLKEKARPYYYKFLSLLLGLSLSGLIVNILKVSIGRYRPRAWLHTYFYKIDPFQVSYSKCSFPSGHSQTIFAVMVSLGLIFPKGRWFFLTVAIIVSATRIALTNHFLSDVVMGAYLGTICAMICYHYSHVWAARIPGVKGQG